MSNRHVTRVQTCALPIYHGDTVRVVDAAPVTKPAAK
jgi:hypothetical protein